MNLYGTSRTVTLRRRLAALLTSLVMLLMVALPASAAELGGLVSVRVIEATGQPVGWATLEVYQLNQGLVTTAVAGLDGIARIPRPSDRGLWLIRAFAEGYQVRETGWFDPARAGTRSITLDPIDGDVHIYVRDAAGQRLDAAVTLLTTSGRLASQGTVDSGRTVFTDVAAGGYRLTVAADGFTPVERPITVAPGRVTVETFVLDSRSLKVEGEVIDTATLAVIRDAQVELLGSGGLLLAKGVTGSDGRFSLTAPHAAETYQLRVSAAGYTTTVTDPRSPAGTGLDFFGNDRVRLAKPSATIEGVLLGFGGDPLEDTTIMLLRDGVGEVAATSTNRDGRFAFSGLPAGGVRYLVMADDVDDDDWNALVISQWVEPIPGATHWMSISTDHYPTLGTTKGRLGGVVLSPAGLPLEGATVELMRNTEVVRTVTTDNFGNFSFDEVTATTREGMFAAPYVLRISKKGYVNTRQITVAGQSQIEFHVPEEGRLSVQATLRPSSVAPKGRVVDENGNPVYDARVEMTIAGKAKPVTARTDTNGWYLLSAVPTHSASVTLRVTADDYLPSDEINISAALSAGDRPPTIRLTKRVSSIDGVVMDLQGVPVGGAKVQLLLDGVVAAEAVAEGDGYYALQSDLTTAATGLLTVAVDGYTQGGAVLNPLPGPGQRLTQPLVVQKDSALLEGRVLDPLGNPVAGAKVEVTLEGEKEMAIVTTAADGTYRLEQPLASGAAWAWLRVRPVTGTFAGSISHGMDMAPIMRLTAGERVVTDLLVRP